MEERFKALWSGVRKPCDGQTEAMFFDPTDHISAAVARRICSSCPLVTLCGEYAIVNGIRWGMWGAMTPQERGWKPAGRKLPDDRPKADHTRSYVNH
jgi:hypothetical protein